MFLRNTYNTKKAYNSEKAGYKTIYNRIRSIQNKTNTNLPRKNLEGKALK